MGFIVSVFLVMVLYVQMALAANVGMTWQSGDEANPQEGFIVYRRSLQGPYDEIGRTGKLETTYVDTTVAIGEVVCYVVRAYATLPDTTEAISGQSNEACAVVLSAPVTLRIDSVN